MPVSFGDSSASSGGAGLSRTEILFPAATVVTAVYSVGPDIALTTERFAHITVRVGRKAQTACTNHAAFIIQANSYPGTSKDSWINVAMIQTSSATTATGINPASNLLSGATIAGATTFTFDSGTGLNAGDLLFVDDGANTEFCRVQSVSSATATLQEGAIYSHADNTQILDLAERIPIFISVMGYRRIRMIVDNACAGGITAAATGQSLYVNAYVSFA